MTAGEPAKRIISLTRLERPEEARIATWAQFVHTQIRLMRVIEQLFESNGLTLAQFDVLSNLRFHAGLTQQDLARRLQVTKGNICGLIDRLEKLQWVERREDVNDRRANRLHLTPAGTEVVDRMRPVHDAVVIGLLNTFSDTETAALTQLLIRLEEAASTL